jgi:hypothetical protein
MEANMTKRATKLIAQGIAEEGLIAGFHVSIALGGAEVGTDRARTILEILLEEEEVCTNDRLGALIGIALDQLDQVKKSVKSVYDIAHPKAN